MPDDKTSLPDDTALKALLDAQQWDDVIAQTDGLPGRDGVPSHLLHQRAQALRGKGALPEALGCISEAIARAPANQWFHVLRFNIRVDMGDPDRAFAELKAFVNSAPPNAEVAKQVLTDRAMWDGRNDLALEVNETRRVIAEHRRVTPYALALQCFNKADTLDQVLQSLIACRGTERFSLTILQDSAEGSNKPDVYGPAAEAVRGVLADWLPRLMQAFQAVELIANPVNKGTAPSCRRLLDRVVTRHEGFLFIEDDCILAPDALDWAAYHLEHSLGMRKTWFASCESVFFDSHERPITDDQRTALTEIARKPGIRAAWLEYDFVPSTCFIATRDVWRHCANYRSFPRGPESLIRYLTQSGAKTLMPVVPRASDLGMLHELGFSVNMLGKAGVKEIKNTYVMSNLDPLDPSEIGRYAGNANLLFSASVHLKDSDIAAAAKL